MILLQGRTIFIIKSLNVCPINPWKFGFIFSIKFATQVHFLIREEATVIPVPKPAKDDTDPTTIDP